MVPSRRLAGALVLAVLLGCGLVAATAAMPVANDDSGGVVTLEESQPTYLSPEGNETRESYATGPIDVSTSAAADSERLSGEYRTAVFEQELEALEPWEREAFIEETVAKLETRSDAIDERHAALLVAHHNGEYSTSELLRELASLTEAAHQQESFADAVELAVVSDPELAVSEEMEALFAAIEFEMANLASPVSDQFVAATLPAGTSIYAQSTEDALVLAAAGETHLRQATLRTERNKSAPNQFLQNGGTTGDALLRAEELYPGLQGFLTPPDDQTHVYTVEGESALGSFEAYIDGGTTNAFHELQSGQSAGVPVEGTREASEGGLELTVELTEPTGPMLVSVTDNGSPVQGAELTIDEWTAGQTNTAGERWVVQPLPGVELRATVGEETVSVSL